MSGHPEEQLSVRDVEEEEKENRTMTKKAKFKRLKPNEFLMLKRERRERDQDVFFNKRTGGTIAVRAAAAEKEWRQRLNLDANLHRTSRKAGTRSRTGSAPLPASGSSDP